MLGLFRGCSVSDGGSGYRARVESYQRRQLLTCVGPISHSDGHDGFGLIDELVPGLAARLDDGVVVFENAV